MKKFTIEGLDYCEKEVKRQSDTAGQIYLPASWIGKKVAVILLESQSPHFAAAKVRGMG